MVVKEYSRQFLISLDSAEDECDVIIRQLICAVPNRLIYEADISDTNPWRDQLTANPLLVKDGHIEPNEEPGLGLQIDEEMLTRFAAIPGSCYVPPR